MTAEAGGEAGGAPQRGRGPRYAPTRFGTGLVTLMVASAYMQYTLSVLGPVLLERFTISRTQLGLLTSVLFIVGSAGSPVAGRLVDRLGARRMIPFPFVANTVAFLLLGLAPSYPVVLAAVAIAGAGMAFANPLSNKLIAFHVPHGQQGLLMGIKQSGVQLAATLAGVVMPAALVLGGLAGAGVGTAVALVVGQLVVFLAVPHDPARPPGGPGALGPVTAAPDAVTAAAATAAAELDARTRRATLLWIGLYAVLMGAGIASVYAYLPLFAVDALGMSVGRAGLLASVIGVMGMASRIIWGAVAERLPHPSSALVLLAGTAVVAQAMLWSAPRTGVAVLWAAVVLLGSSAVAWNTVAMFTVIRVLGAGAAGANSGVIQLAFFSGFAIGPIVFGLLIDASGSYDLGWGAIMGAFTLATLLAGRWALLTHREGRGHSSR